MLDKVSATADPVKCGPLLQKAGSYYLGQVETSHPFSLFVLMIPAHW